MEKICVTTRELTFVYEKREEIAQLANRIRILTLEKQELVNSLKDKEESIVMAIRLGAVVQSRKYLVALKNHVKQAYINWQKTFREKYPLEYKSVQAKAGTIDYTELIIVRGDN